MNKNKFKKSNKRFYFCSYCFSIFVQSREKMIKFDNKYMKENQLLLSYFIFLSFSYFAYFIFKFYIVNPIPLFFNKNLNNLINPYQKDDILDDSL